MARRLEASHRPFALTSWLVGVFGAIIEAPMLAVLHTGQDILLGRAIAAKFIGDEPPWNVLAAFEQFAEELLRCRLVPPALDQDIQHVAMLIDGAPQVVRFAADLDENLVQMPFVARLRPTLPQLIGVLLPDAQAPLSNAFVRDLHAACCQ